MEAMRFRENHFHPFPDSTLNRMREHLNVYPDSNEYFLRFTKSSVKINYRFRICECHCMNFIVVTLIFLVLFLTKLDLKNDFDKKNNEKFCF